MPARQRAAAHVAGNAPPFAERVEASLDHAFLAPQHAQRTRDSKPAFEVGAIMFEVDGVPANLAREALTLGAAKLPIRTRFVARIGDA